jgi:hypothetical protein
MFALRLTRSLNSFPKRNARYSTYTALEKGTRENIHLTQTPVETGDYVICHRIPNGDPYIFVELGQRTYPQERGNYSKNYKRHSIIFHNFNQSFQFLKLQDMIHIYTGNYETIDDMSRSQVINELEKIHNPYKLIPFEWARHSINSIKKFPISYAFMIHRYIAFGRPII